MTDYQTVSRGLDDLSRDSVKLVYLEHSFDLGEVTSCRVSGMRCMAPSRWSESGLEYTCMRMALVRDPLNQGAIDGVRLFNG